MHDEQDRKRVAATEQPTPEGIRLHETDGVSADGVRSDIRPSVRDSTAVLRKWVWLAAILAGAIQVWTHRYTLSTHDSVSYLDIADAYLRNDWQAALNVHWSPLYSWLLALALSILEPTPYSELFVVKLVNFLVYLGALVALRLLSESAHRTQPSTIGTRRPGWLPQSTGVGVALIRVLAVSLVCSQVDDPPQRHAGSEHVRLCLPGGRNPAAGPLRRGWVAQLSASRRRACASLLIEDSVAAHILGLSRGRLTFDGQLPPKPPTSRCCGAGVGGGVAPFVAALSAHENRLTFGDAGKYMYVLFVNPGFPVDSLLHWQGDERPAEFGVPEHTTREIYGSPAAFEFKTPIAGSYPPCSTHRTGTLGSRSASISSAKRGFSQRTCCSLGLRFLEYWLSAISPSSADAIGSCLRSRR